MAPLSVLAFVAVVSVCVLAWLLVKKRRRPRDHEELVRELVKEEAATLRDAVRQQARRHEAMVHNFGTAYGLNERNLEQLQRQFRQIAQQQGQVSYFTLREEVRTLHQIDCQYSLSDGATLSVILGVPSSRYVSEAQDRLNRLLPTMPSVQRGLTTADLPTLNRALQVAMAVDEIGVLEVRLSPSPLNTTGDGTEQKKAKTVEKARTRYDAILEDDDFGV